MLLLVDLPALSGAAALTDSGPPRTFRRLETEAAGVEAGQAL